MSTITKKELALRVSDSTGCKKNLAAKMVDGLFVAMRDSLIDGNRIEIRGFGVFQVKNTRPKPAARNPRTGDIIYVPARRKTHFKPGRLLKEALHQAREEEPQEQSQAQPQAQPQVQPQAPSSEGQEAAGSPGV
ncbi:MAG: integration host factor subunit beta [Gemmatimonadetes bacterium]|nr:integration host factor subunit beta [Gemmatimonadota bacterium]